MQTILVVLDAKKLENPDLDIRYALPDKVEQYTNNEISDNGYDYLTDTELGIWLATKSAQEDYGRVVEFFEHHMVCGNDLAGTAKIYISDQEDSPLEECTLVYDGEAQMPNKATRVTNQAQKVSKIILKIANLITKEDKAVSDALERKLNELKDRSKQWECFTEILKEYQYICECDEDIELDEFLEMLMETPMVKSNVLPVKKNKLDAEDELYGWCEALDEQWEETGYCMTIYELENENEVVFPCRIEKLEEIGELAKEVGVSKIKYNKGVKKKYLTHSLYYGNLPKVQK